MAAFDDYGNLDIETHRKMCHEIDKLREHVEALRTELAKWGFGDFHYGPQDQVESIRVLLAIDPNSFKPTPKNIKLICLEYKHETLISKEQIRQMNCAPVCTAPFSRGICGSAIWAIDFEYEGNPRVYVGKPPHKNWTSWADIFT